MLSNSKIECSSELREKFDNKVTHQITHQIMIEKTFYIIKLVN